MRNRLRRAFLRIALFTVTTIAGTFGTALGALPGATFGDLGFIGGGMITGVLAVFATIVLLARTRVVPHAHRRHVLQGAAVGYGIFAVLAVATLATMIGPVLATLCIGAGAVFGDVQASQVEQQASGIT